MKKLFLIRFSSLLLLFSAFAVSSCNNDDDHINSNDSEKSISEIATSKPELSNLVSALNKTGLTATLNAAGTYTVFAPTNAAFNNFLADNGFETLDQVPTETLKQVLLNHVIGTTLLSTNLNTGYIKTLAKGTASSTNALSMFVNTSDGVVLNGGSSNNGAKVSNVNIVANNGVIHLVDHVINLPTVVNHAIANPQFSTLVQALTRADQPNFVGILSGSTNAPFTVFAPTNQAFTNLLTELNINGLANVPQAVLENTLKYHVVVRQNILANQLTNNMSVPTFQGGNLTIDLSSGAKIKDANNRLSSIVATDVQATNGVIHAIDKVLLP